MQYKTECEETLSGPDVLTVLLQSFTASSFLQENECELFCKRLNQLLWIDKDAHILCMNQIHESNIMI